ncbi:MAG: hypothetical protein ACRD1T_10655, partial [Acidimicrobiia bacterium]
DETSPSDGFHGCCQSWPAGKPSAEGNARCGVPAIDTSGLTATGPGYTFCRVRIETSWAAFIYR